MILSGDPVKGDYALSCGLVDALFESGQNFRTHVLGFATRCQPRRAILSAAVLI